MKTALVTGSSGFVGRHLVSALTRRGFDVCEIDIKNRYRPRDARVFFRDNNQHFNVVIHAAATIGGRAGIDGHRTLIGAYNLQLDGALFEWALTTRPDHLVYLSSSAVYPVAHQSTSFYGSLEESSVSLVHPQLPDATYGWTKLTGERLAFEYELEGGLVHVVRPFSGYGADQDRDYPFGAFLYRAHAAKDTFEVWGDGSATRDWIHISDIINAIFAIMNNHVCGPINICTGRGTSFDQLAHMFIDMMNRTPRIVHRQGMPAGVAYRVGNPERMLHVYSPQISLETGVAMSLAETS